MSQLVDQASLKQTQKQTVTPSRNVEGSTAASKTQKTPVRPVSPVPVQPTPVAVKKQLDKSEEQSLHQRSGSNAVASSGTQSQQQSFSLEYKQFISMAQLQNPQQYRQKKLSLQNLLRLVEEIYAHRYLKDTQKLQSQNSSFNPTEKPFYASVFELMNQKYKQKKMLDQNIIDLIASIDFFKTQSTEIETFYNFFTANYDVKDLMFYLYLRSLAEKEVNQVVTRLQTGDVRQLKLPASKCLKLIKSFFSTIGIT